MSSGRPADTTADDDDDHRRLTMAASRAANRTRTGNPETMALLDSELHRPDGDEN